MGEHDDIPVSYYLFPTTEEGERALAEMQRVADEVE